MPAQQGYGFCLLIRFDRIRLFAYCLGKYFQFLFCVIIFIAVVSFVNGWVAA